MPTPILTTDILFFFDGHAGSMPLYEALAKRLLSEYPETQIQVKKTQISFQDGHLYACASLTPVRRRAERPDPFLTVTFGSDVPIASSRLVCVPIRPNRYTHHALIGSADEIDETLMGWIDASHKLTMERT